MSPFHASPSLAGQQQTMHRPMTKRFVTLPKPSPDPAARRSTQSKYASGMCHALTCSGSRMLNVRLCRCMAHSLNLAAKHVLEAFARTPHRVLAKGKHSCTAEPVDDDEEEEEEEIESDEEEDGESDEEEEMRVMRRRMARLMRASLSIFNRVIFLARRMLLSHRHVRISTALVMLFLTAAICRCASPHKPAHSSPSNASQSTCLSLSFSSGVAHDGRPWTI